MSTRAKDASVKKEKNTKSQKSVIFINNTSHSDELKMDLYASLAELLYESKDAVIKGFSRLNLDITKKEDRVKYVLHSTNILMNSFNVSKEDMPSRISFFDIKEIANGIFKGSGNVSTDTVKSHFVKLGLSLLKHQDISFYFQLCNEVERRNLLKKEKSSDSARIFKTTGAMICPHCGHAHFFSMGSVIDKKGVEHKKFQCKKCRKTIIPGLWNDENIIGKKDTVLSVFTEYYGVTNSKNIDRDIFLSSVKS